MSTTHNISAVLVTLQVLKENIPPNEWNKTPLPVIAAPKTWMDLVAREHGQNPEDVTLDEIHGCKLIRRDDLAEPILIDHDGRTYPVLLPWQRKPAAVEGSANEGSELD